MELVQIIKILENSKQKIFYTRDLKKLLNIKKENTLYKTAQKLLRKKILNRLTKGVYFFTSNPPNEFEIANSLYFPSYISLESALNFYGILIQAPYQIISVTPKRPKEIKVNKREYIYLHLSPKYFWGYQRIDNFTIAQSEKAVIDEIYFASKGREIVDFKECNLEFLNKSKLKSLAKKIKWIPFQKLFKKTFHDH